MRYEFFCSVFVHKYFYKIQINSKREGCQSYIQKGLFC